MTKNKICIVRGCKKPQYRSSVHDSQYCDKHLGRDFPKLSKTESLRQADKFYKQMTRIESGKAWDYHLFRNSLM